MGTEKRNTRTRQKQIARAALEIMGERGVDKLSIAEVARRVGLVPSGIYRHFRGKSQILDAVLELINWKLQENVRAVKEETDAPLERLRLLLMRHARLITGDGAIPRVVFSESVYGGSPDQKKKLHEVISNYTERIEEIVEEGRRSGEIRREVKPERAAVMFLGMIQPGAILWHLSDGEFDVAQQAEEAWRLFSRALRPR
ncbi:MAG: TetR/AcrR family transcriptional regulator [Candidatus Brocadiia bacterium]